MVLSRPVWTSWYRYCNDNCTLCGDYIQWIKLMYSSVWSVFNAAHVGYILRRHNVLTSIMQTNFLKTRKWKEEGHKIRLRRQTRPIIQLIKGTKCWERKGEDRKSGGIASNVEVVWETTVFNATRVHALCVCTVTLRVYVCQRIIFGSFVTSLNQKIMFSIISRTKIYLCERMLHFNYLFSLFGCRLKIS